MATPTETMPPAATNPPSGPGKRGQLTQEEFQSEDGWLTQTDYISKVVYWGIHASCLLVFVVGAPKAAVTLCVVNFLIRVFGITGGYHRYFAHKSYKTSRPFQFFLAWLGCMSTQKGPLWWAGTHRRHHRYSDQPGDPHSPKEGWYYSHQGWIFDGRWSGTPTEGIKDFAKYPELVWLNKYHFVPPIFLAVVCYWIAGFAGLVWGFAVSTTLQWHSTYFINSLCHLWGSQRYETGDTSRNNPWLALLTLGEGWHNNHHYYAASARNGFYWWEIDITWYVLRTFEALGLIWDVKRPTAQIMDGGKKRLGRTLPEEKAAA